MWCPIVSAHIGAAIRSSVGIEQITVALAGSGCALEARKSRPADPASEFIGLHTHMHVERNRIHATTCIREDRAHRLHTDIRI
jgi:hypothetical protein